MKAVGMPHQSHKLGTQMKKECESSILSSATMRNKNIVKTG